jgi:predicted aspartyl protease
LKTIFSENYTDALPLIDIDLIINSTNDKASLKALLDTGNSGGILLTKKDVAKLNLKLGIPTNNPPARCRIADGSSIAVYWYNAIVKFKGEQAPAFLRVLDPDQVYDEEEDDPRALFGLAIMNNYQVTFNGSSHPKSYSFSK